MRRGIGGSTIVRIIIFAAYCFSWLRPPPPQRISEPITLRPAPSTRTTLTQQSSPTRHHEPQDCPLVLRLPCPGRAFEAGAGHDRTALGGQEGVQGGIHGHEAHSPLQPAAHPGSGRNGHPPEPRADEIHRKDRRTVPGRPDRSGVRRRSYGCCDRHALPPAPHDARTGPREKDGDAKGDGGHLPSQLAGQPGEGAESGGRQLLRRWQALHWRHLRGVPPELAPEGCSGRHPRHDRRRLPALVRFGKERDERAQDRAIQGVAGMS